MRKALNNQWPVLVIIVVAIVSRLSQLLSPHFTLDGDECIMGIMAKHFVEGKTIPWFFYGQKYGFAFIEVLAVSAGYLVFGMSDYVVKLSVFVLWIGGVVFFYKSLLTISNNKFAALVFALLLVLTPAWAAWSMKARGGYITAFLCSNILLYLSVTTNGSNSGMKWFISGIVTAVIFFSQPLWLPGILPFLLVALWKGKLFSKLLPFLIGVMVVVLFILVIRSGQSTYWQPDVIPGIIYPFAKVCRYAYYNFTGFYYLQNVADAPFIISGYVYLLSGCILTALTGALILIVKKSNQSKKLLVAAFIAALGTFAYFFIIDITSPRYALPLTGYATLLLFITWQYTHSRLRIVANSLVVILLLGGGYSLYLFKDYRFEIDKAVIKDAVVKMQERGITHVYATDPLLYWNFVFYSQEEIIGRHFGKIDRHVPYITETDSVHAVVPHQTAVLTRYPVLEVVDPNDMVQLNEVFYIYQNPTRPELEQMGFEFH